MASGAIKGITVEIGGDTTKLGKAIGDSEKQSRSLQVELKQIEKLLQFDPTNTELLIQKQNVLADMISETSKKLDVMKEAEAQVVAQFERGEIGENQLRAFQREIMQTENALDSMQSGLKDATYNLELYGDNNGVAKAEAAKLEKQIQEQNDALEAEKRALQEAEEAQKKHEKAVEDAKKTVSDFKDKVGDMAKVVATGAAAVGAAAVAGGGYALNLSTEFDKAFNTLVTKTGASADEMDALNEAMESVYANNFGESIEDVANSMATVRQNTKLSGDELQTATEGALLLRDTFEFEVNESTRAAKMLMDQYGVSAEDAYNLIAQGAQNGLDKNGDLLDTINEYGVHFKNLGLNADDMFNVLANGAANGTFSVDKLGDAVKEFGIRVVDDSESTRDAFKSIGLNCEEMEDKFTAGGDSAKEAFQATIDALKEVENPIARNTAGVALFGTMWEDLGEDAIFALGNVDGSISTTKAALDDINNQKYDDIGSALQGLGRTLETDVIVPLGEELQPVVETAIDYVKENAPQIKDVLSEIVTKIGDFVGWIVNNGDKILSVITGIGAGFIAWKVASTITAVVNAIKAFKLANEGATIAQWLFNAAMNANPIVLLVTVIAAVVAAIVTFIATNDEARAKFIEIWTKVKEVCASVVDSIVNFFTVTVPQAFNAFIEWIKANWQSILLFLINPFAGLFKYFYENNGKFKEFVDNAVAYIKELPGKIGEWLTNTITTVGDWIAEMWAKAVEAGSSFVNGVIDFFVALPGKIGEWLSGAIGQVASWGQSMWSKAVEVASTFVNNVALFLRSLPGKVWTWLSGVITQVSTWGQSMWSKAVSIASDFVNAVSLFIRQLPGKIWAWLSNVISNVVSWGTSMVANAKQAAGNFLNGVVNVIKNIPERVKGWLGMVVNRVVSWGSEMAEKGKKAAKDLFDAVVNKIKEIPGDVVSIGSDIVKGLWNGISDMGTWIGNKIKGFGDSVLGSLKRFFGIASPSKLMRDEVGRYIAEGIGVGIENNADKPLDALRTLSEDMAAQDFNFNDATVNRKLNATFTADPVDQANKDSALLSKLDNIYDRLNRLQIVLDTGVLVGETLDKIDAGLADKQLLSARGV